MKKHLIKFTCLTLCCLFIFAATSIVSAASTADSDVPSPASDVIRPIAYDQYYPSTFNTLSAAKAKFGSAYSYIQCYQYYAGNVYNYYFFYSDYSRQYIRVIHYSDDNTVLSIPNEICYE